MIDFMNLMGRIEGMEPEAALDEVEKVIAETGEQPNTDIALLKAKILFALSDRKRNEGGSEGCFFEIIMLLEPLIEELKFNPDYAQYLYMLAVSNLELHRLDEAEIYTERFAQVSQGDNEAAFLSAIIQLDKQDYQKAQSFIETYLQSGEFLRGVIVKIDILLYAGKYDQALSLIESCRTSYPDEERIWSDQILSYHRVRGDFDSLNAALDKRIETASDSNVRRPYFYEKLDLFGERGDFKGMDAYMKEYAEKYPEDYFVYAAMAHERKKPKDKIALLEKAIDLYYDEAGAMQLLYLYTKNADPRDKERVFQLVKKLSDNEGFRWQAVNLALYGPYYRYDEGVCAAVMEKAAAGSDADECDFSMLGKIYEFGVGVTPDLKKAFDAYAYAYKNLKDHCGCGALFYAYALYYGVGTPQNREAAKRIILEIIDERDNDQDRICLYAIMAHEENDSRFDKQHAKKMLRKHSSDCNCAFLLSKFADGEADKVKYFEKFKKSLKKAEAFCRDHLSKYAENPDEYFVPFISN